MFDLLASADLLVPDAAVAAATLRRALGILPARDQFLQVWPEWGFEAHWCRVARRLGRAPTHLEIISPRGTPDPTIHHPHIAALFEHQRPRMHKTHSTPVAVNDLDRVTRRLFDARAPYRLDAPEGALPFPRLWIGHADGTPGRYDPSGDGGLQLELMNTSDMGFPILTDPVPPEPRPGDGLVRIEARTMLVDDVADVLRRLERNLGWDSDATVITTSASRRAQLRFTHVHSAVLELIEPLDPESHEGRYFARWGRGPYGMRIEVDDLGETSARLAASGIAVKQTERIGRPTLLPDPDQLFGVQFELVAT